MPQGSVLWPILFTLFVFRTAQTATNHGACQPQCTDVTKLFTSIFYNNTTSQLNGLEECLLSWFYFFDDDVALNLETTTMLFFSPFTSPQNPSTIFPESVSLVHQVARSDKVKLLGIALDFPLTLDNHTVRSVPLIALSCQSAPPYEKRNF